MLILTIAYSSLLLQETEGISNLKVQVVEGIASVEVCMHQLLNVLDYKLQKDVTTTSIEIVAGVEIWNMLNEWCSHKNFPGIVNFFLI